MKRRDYTKKKKQKQQDEKNKYTDCEDPFFKEGVVRESPLSTSTTCFSHIPYITNNVKGKQNNKKKKKKGCQMLAVSIGCVQAHACDVFLVLVYN